MRLNLKAVEERVRPLGGRDHYDREFIFDLLAAYGRSKSSITRLRNGSSFNIADDPMTEVAQRNVLYFKETNDDLYLAIDELSKSIKVVRFNIRFVIVTDYQELLAVDTKTGETLAISISDIDKHFTFFLPWAGMEKAQYVAESHADVKAAERMAKLYDELIAINPDVRKSDESRHALNVFFTRLLFCFFAEDTDLFDKKLFTITIESWSQPDGSDLHELLGNIFLALDTENQSEKPAHLAKFPYVNGRLFAVKDRDIVPVFNKKSRDLLIDNGRLLWNQINPDIFGSMFQAVVSDDDRSELGQHYTSVPNILKTIEPLFLDELRGEFDKHFESVAGLTRLLERIAKIKIFDPACGSGNFLVIAYKELRTLEHAILDRVEELRGGVRQTQMLGPRVDVDNFYGIEIGDFAAEVAILSLWIAKHQMNLEFKKKFHTVPPLIPLKQMGQVVQGNAARMDWKTVCPNDGKEEIYLISNPPYAGARIQKSQQKADFPFVFHDKKYSRDLDYVAIWLELGARYISDSNAELAFVTTNSVTQGEQVVHLFPGIFDRGLEIGFAHTSFKWENNARRNAGVTVVVINLRNNRKSAKHLFTDGIRIEVENINGYLAAAPNEFIASRRSPISKLPAMSFGSMPNDGGGLLLTSLERDALVSEHPCVAAVIKRYTGSKEYIAGLDRYALWMNGDEFQAIQDVDLIADRVDSVRSHRDKSNRESTKRLASVPWRFGEIRYKPTESIIVPRVSSERREYIPIGYLDKDTVISDAALAIYDAEPWVFALLTSRMHMAWTRAVGGKLKTDYRYSATIVYNNFPVPELSDSTKNELADAAFRVLDIREYHSEKSLADLYDPDKMPPELQAVHQELDDLVDSMYTKKELGSDEERLSTLFELYRQMTTKGALG